MDYSSFSVKDVKKSISSDVKFNTPAKITTTKDLILAREKMSDYADTLNLRPNKFRQPPNVDQVAKAFNKLRCAAIENELKGRAFLRAILASKNMPSTNPYHFIVYHLEKQAFDLWSWLNTISGLYSTRDEASLEIWMKLR
jgi:hypothetical protein